MHHSKATKAKIRKARLGTHHTPATIAKIQAAMLERAALVRAGLLPAYHHSEATKAKMRKAARHRKPSRKAILASVSSRKDRLAYTQAMEAVDPGYIRRERRKKRAQRTSKTN